MDLKEKVVFISGSSRGIGQAIAQAFAKAGSNVILNARTAVKPELVAQIESYGVKAAVVLGDISQASDVKRMVKEAYAAFGQIDILVNNAGITNDKLLIGMKEADFASVIDVNLKGTFLMSQAFLKKMYKQKAGVIINLASVIGLHGNVGQANYAASKAGVIGLTKSLAKEGALRNIRANAIAPGMIVSDMTAVLSDKVKADIMTEIPLKRFGQADEVAQTAVFLAQNDYITGQVITVDGGMTI
ncbi:3-oxoacyl-[acyl-carrier-protein] reductase [Ligilactobacillus agilis]|uniref:3-oxoacyl-[acyl-carrier-protein] reductase n=2 Tax=Ligilactobacillus agilis TaxID=1601 RepID=A0A0R2AIK2_9LACO|nr:3-oxoacyl-[acyl-carrier-protein] reductase [Ligilactobacillus agilis]ASR41116.1 3-oxoacyl-[acyl-carrier-protein] reductase [Ligilactobacillus agilis]KRM63654.1 3-ketoacyl-(acyl-carrier-protein) reductase [Ligilactobacillus agilis DSM 20509]MBL1056646.1 3-oxoacyl-[acyl-carrier-protein] reductase [Ligilactobacillus agilis]MBM6772482.1 3-oxoacyl-[acyl-carrier-protein] reductase [Ligilactobacillus agilis]MCI5762148.1 3-oxoacyl-[acyl-carrier-protein] reductase [Ligilactobacillus agilis]